MTSGASTSARLGYASLVSRRGFLVLGGTGAAGAVLTACGEPFEPRADDESAELLQAQLTAELGLADAYDLAAGTQQGQERSALETFARAASERAEALRQLAPDATAEPPGGAVDGGPDGPEALSATIVLANAAIAAHRLGAGGSPTTETRGVAASQLVACAAELAVVSGFAGEPEVPRAFVTGAEAEPYEAADGTDDETTSTTTDETSTGEGQTTSTAESEG